MRSRKILTTTSPRRTGDGRKERGTLKNLLHILRRLCYNKHSQKVDEMPRHSKNGRTPESGNSPGFVYAVGLLLLAVSLKPFANAGGNYACSERHQKVDDIRHDTHPLPVASVGRGSKGIIPVSDRLRKKKRSEHGSLLLTGAESAAIIKSGKGGSPVCWTVERPTKKT